MEPAKQARGRPRDYRLDHTIAAVVRELLIERGYAGLTMDAVAAAAGAGKAAIYRRYRSKADMVFGSIVHGAAPSPLPDNGSLLADLTHLCRMVYASMNDPVAAAAVPGLMADLAGHPEVMRRFQQTFYAHQRTQLEALLSRAHDRGEIAAPWDTELVHSMVVGTMFAWIFVLSYPATADLPARAARALTASLAR